MKPLSRIVRPKRLRGFTEPDGTKSKDAPANWPFGVKFVVRAPRILSSRERVSIRTAPKALL